jgi:murein DD-endopeptidase MepM/ murein hydrolase activator NlpD
LAAFFGTDVDSHRLETLRAQNQELEEANRSFEESLARLQTQLAEYESRTKELAIVAGLDAVAGGGVDAGIGGEAAVEPDFLAYRADRLAGTLDLVENRLEERMRWISSTPAIAPVKGILTSAYGSRRDPINGGHAFHPAIDIAAPPGRPVLATADGIVTRAGRIGGLGNAVYISHGYGVATRYGHMSKLDVKPGERIQRGDVIGYVGNSGRSTGYHLHYEVHVDGKPINPLAYILDGTSS